MKRSRFTIIEVLVVLAILGIVLGMVWQFFGTKWITKKFGGTITMEIPVDKKLMNVTWKDSNIWYLVRDRKEGEKAETYQFMESSNLGVLQGTVVIKEK